MILGGVFFLEIRNIQPKKVLIIAALIVVAFIFGVTLSQSVKNSTAQENYQHAVKNTYQSVADVKYILQNIADNLNIQNSDQNNFLQALENSKEILANENKNLNQLEVPAEYSDVHKKIIDCLKTEYNLLDRLKENFAIQNEYEAAENFVKSKELFTNLKEQSAFLMVKGIDFEEVFDLSAVSEKLEKYFSAKKQARYEKDQKEQEEREKAAAAERERIEREKQKNLAKTLNVTPEEFQQRFNENLLNLVDTQEDYEKYKIFTFNNESYGIYDFKTKFVSISGIPINKNSSYLRGLNIMADIPQQNNYIKTFMSMCTLTAHSVNGKKDIGETFEIINKLSANAAQRGEYELTDGGLKYSLVVGAFNGQLHLFFTVVK